MSNIANASIDVIKKFNSENSDLNFDLQTLRSSIFNSASSLQLDCESKLKTLSDISKEAVDLLVKARNSKDTPEKSAVVSQGERLVSTLGAQRTKIEQMHKTLSDFISYLLPAVDNAMNMSQNVGEQLKSVIKIIEMYRDYILKI